MQGPVRLQQASINSPWTGEDNDVKLTTRCEVSETAFSPPTVDDGGTIRDGFEALGRDFAKVISEDP